MLRQWHRLFHCAVPVLLVSIGENGQTAHHAFHLIPPTSHMGNEANNRSFVGDQPTPRFYSPPPGDPTSTVECPWRHAPGEQQWVVSQNAIPGGLAPAVQSPRANSIIPVGPVSRTPR